MECLALLLIPLTALLSALHGHNTFGKGYLIAGHVICTAFLGQLMGLPYVVTAVLAAAIPSLFWFVLRGGWQADAEQEAMEYPTDWHLAEVAISHIPHLLITLIALGYGGYLGHWTAWAGIGASLLVFPLPLLALGRWNYDNPAVQHLKNNGKFWDIRRPTEIATGISGGVQSAAMLWVLLSMMRA